MELPQIIWLLVVLFVFILQTVRKSKGRRSEEHRPHKSEDKEMLISELYDMLDSPGTEKVRVPPPPPIEKRKIPARTVKANQYSFQSSMDKRVKKENRIANRDFHNSVEDRYHAPDTRQTVTEEWGQAVVYGRTSTNTTVKDLFKDANSLKQMVILHEIMKGPVCLTKRR